jgi:amidase
LEAAIKASIGVRTWRGEPLSVASVQRDRILCLCAHGGLTGVPQIPGSTVGGLPIGLSIVGGHGSDASLVALTAAVTIS